MIPMLKRNAAIRRLLVIAGIVIGIPCGIGGYTFLYAEGLSYLSSDPEACVNCHIMRPQFDSWHKSSHRSVAVCVDCHLPTGLVEKYMAKAENGYWHSRGFTLQDFHEPIRINEKNSRILQENCLRCHGDMVDRMLPGATTDRDAILCVHCHRSVGHGEPAGLGGALRKREIPDLQLLQAR